MFSLIITIVSIALVVALIAATMYYGADTLTRGQAAANAAAIISGGEQVLAAMTAFQAQTGRYPNNLEELITSNYLRSFPELASAGFDLISSAHAAPVDGVGDWLYDHETPHLAYVGTLDMDTCAEVNNQISEQRIVLNVIDPDPRAQCVVKGAQDPVVVFRHPGEKDFTGWDEHPRIPDVGWSGAIQEVGEAVKDGTYVPDEDSVCMHGCTEEDLGGEPGEPAGPRGVAMELTARTLADYNQNDFCYPGSEKNYCQGFGTQTGASANYPAIAYRLKGIDEDGSNRWFCLPLLDTLTDADSFEFDGEPYGGASTAAGVTFSATMQMVYSGGEKDVLALPQSDRALYIGVYDGSNWSIPTINGTVTSTVSSGDSSIPETYGGLPPPSYQALPGFSTAVPGELGICGYTNSGGYEDYGVYQVDLSAVKGSESSSIRFFLFSHQS